MASFQEQAEFVIADVTEIERPQAWKTEYVGTLKDGKTKGFWALILATACRGGAIPCGLITYSSKTLARGLDSRNLNHLRAFEPLPGSPFRKKAKMEALFRPVHLAQTELVAFSQQVAADLSPLL